MYLDSDKKILPLCYKHVVSMSSHKCKEKYHQLVFSELSVLEHLTGNLLEILFEVCPFLLILVLYQAVVIQ